MVAVAAPASFAALMSSPLALVRVLALDPLLEVARCPAVLATDQEQVGPFRPGLILAMTSTTRSRFDGSPFTLHKRCRNVPRRPDMLDASKQQDS